METQIKNYESYWQEQDFDIFPNSKSISNFKDLIGCEAIIVIGKKNEKDVYEKSSNFEEFINILKENLKAIYISSEPNDKMLAYQLQQRGAKVDLITYSYFQPIIP